MGKEQFYQDVINGLRARQKYLLSKYFYDAEGDLLFQKIMGCEDYYPTRCEMEILTEQTQNIVCSVLGRDEKVDILELGPGDATKSIHLIRKMDQHGELGSYIPIDISPHIIKLLKEKFQKEFPHLSFYGISGEYFNELPNAISHSENRKVILLLGGNACNYQPETTLNMLKKLNGIMKKGDMALIGFDLKKDPRIIRAAYFDRDGFTSRFNLNLLSRINRELGGDFVIENFTHYACYDPQTGACKSFLISESDQEVFIRDERISFGKGEPVFMEISQKYDLHTIAHIAEESGFVQKDVFTDRKNYFSDVLWQKA